VPPSGKPPVGFIDVDLTPRELLQHLEAWVRRRLLAQAQFAQQGVEAPSSSWIANAQVPLEVFHVSARGEEDTQHIAILSTKRAKLARFEAA